MMAPAVVRRITGGGPLLGDIGIELRTMTGVATPVLASFRLLGEMDPAVEGAVRSPIGPLGAFLCLGAQCARLPGAPPYRGASTASLLGHVPAMLVCAYEAHHDQPSGRSRCSPQARGEPSPSPSLAGGSGGPGGSSWSNGLWAPGAPVRGARPKRPSLDRARPRRDTRDRV